MFLLEFLVRKILQIIMNKIVNKFAVRRQVYAWNPSKTTQTYIECLCNIYKKQKKIHNFKETGDSIYPYEDQIHKYLEFLAKSFFFDGNQKA